MNKIKRSVLVGCRSSDIFNDIETSRSSSDYLLTFSIAKYWSNITVGTNCRRRLVLDDLQDSHHRSLYL